MSCLLYLEILDKHNISIYYKKRDYYYVCMRYFLFLRRSFLFDVNTINQLAKHVRKEKNLNIIKKIKTSYFSIWENEGEMIYCLTCDSSSYMIIGACLIGLLLSDDKQEDFIKEFDNLDN